MEEVKKSRTNLISIETAIKYAQASIYALKHSANEITAKSIAEEMKMHYQRYDEKIIGTLVKAYIQEEKKND